VSARVGVSLCGAIALVVLVRAAAYYAKTDPLALGLVVAMGVALVGAIGELLQRVRKADTLARELATLPRPAQLAAVEGASDGLRPLLQARLTHSAGSIAGAPLAGYVVGLLVMLGLLGTFLGLFETLRGAREALTSSGDVEALRASLGAPMQGLTRSFGTSAAGVSASAMLGLAAAIARRTESRFARALTVYAAGALAPLTVQARQLDALERLARQGEALPRAIAALDAAAARLTSLEAGWSAAHADATAQTAGMVRGAVERIGSDLERAVERIGSDLERAVARIGSDLERTVAQAGSAAESAIAPLVTSAVEGSVAAAKTHIGEVRAILDADLAARRTSDAAHGRAQEEAFARSAAAEEARAQTLAARWGETSSALDATLARAEARSEARELAFSRAAAEIASSASAAVAAASERLEQADARVAAHALQLGTLVAAIEAREEAAANLAGEQRAAVDALLTAAATRAEALDANARAGHAALLAEVERGLSAHAARAIELERSLGAELAAHSDRLASALALQITEREAQLDAVAASVRDAVAGVQAGGTELAAVAEMFAGAVDRHREGASEWLAALGTVEGAIVRASEEAAGGALAEQLDRARELFDAQLQFHRELLLQLRGAHVAMEPRQARQDEDAPA
jgi:hypothetical protein